MEPASTSVSAALTSAKTYMKSTMKRLQVLGTGCAKCERLLKNAQAAVGELGVEATVEKISDMGEILTFGVPTTPALVIDGTVKVAGRVPEVAEIKSWLAAVSSELPINTPAVFASSEPQKCCCGETAQVEEESPCCGPPPPAKDWSTEPDDAPWIVGTVDTPAGPVPKVSTVLKWTDRLGSWKARWGIGRMQFWVKPRLYAVGSTRKRLARLRLCQLQDELRSASIGPRRNRRLDSRVGHQGHQRLVCGREGNLRHR